MDFQDFYAQLKKGDIRRLYLFEGEEEFGKESALSALKSALLKGPMAMMNDSVLVNPTDSDLIAVCETLPILEDRRLVVVKDCQQLLTRGKARNDEGGEDEDAPEARGKKAQDISAYLSKLPETVCLVYFVRGKARGNARLYKTIRDLGGVVSFDQLDQEKLVRWVAREFKNYGLNAQRQTIEHLIFACGKELMMLKGEIAKISAYAQGKDAVTQEDIDAIASLSVDYKVFDLADKVADGDAKKALPLMADMLRGGEQRLMLLALLQRHYRQLLITRILMDRNASQVTIASELGLPGFVARRLIQSAQGYTTGMLKDAYQKTIQQEYLVKSGQTAEDGCLENLVLALIHLKKEGKVGSRA